MLLVTSYQSKSYRHQRISRIIVSLFDHFVSFVCLISFSLCLILKLHVFAPFFEPSSLQARGTVLYLIGAVLGLCMWPLNVQLVCATCKFKNAFFAFWVPYFDWLSSHSDWVQFEFHCFIPMKKRCKTDAHSDQLFRRRDPNWLVIGSLSWCQSWVLQPCWEEEHVGRLTYSTICHSHFWGVQSSLVLAWSRTWTEPWLELRCTQCWSMLDLYYVHQVPSKSMRPWFCATLAKESTETMVLRLQWELTRQQGQLVWNFGILCLVLLYRV